MRNIKLLLIILAFFAFVRPLGVLACDIKPFATDYVNQIHQVFGGEKPKLVILNGYSDESVAYYNYDEKTIYIYKTDYKESCALETPYLKSVIAHEYAHHLRKTLGKIADLKDEDLAYVAEHAIADQIFGGAEYDNDIEAKNINQYEKIKKIIWEKQIKKFISQNNLKKLVKIKNNLLNI